MTIIKFLHAVIYLSLIISDKAFKWDSVIFYMRILLPSSLSLWNRIPYVALHRSVRDRQISDSSSQKERRKEGRKNRAHSPQTKPNQKKTFLSISSVVAYEEIAAVSCVCFTVSCCRLSVCLSVGEKQDTHCWWFQSAVWDFLRACSTCLSHPATVCTGYLLLFQARS